MDGLIANACNVFLCLPSSVLQNHRTPTVTGNGIVWWVRAFTKHTLRQAIHSLVRLMMVQHGECYFPHYSLPYHFQKIQVKASAGISIAQRQLTWHFQAPLKNKVKNPHITLLGGNCQISRRQKIILL